MLSSAKGMASSGAAWKLTLLKRRQAFLRDGQRVRAGIDAVQAADARRDQRGPTPAAAAGIEADGIARQAVPGEDRKISHRTSAAFRTGHAALVEALPFPAEIADGGTIKIVRLLSIARKDPHLDVFGQLMLRGSGRFAFAVPTGPSA